MPEGHCPENRPGVFYPFILLAVPLFLYWPALRVFFSLDDMKFLMRAAGLEESPLTLKRIISTQLFFRSAWDLFSTTEWAYHLVILILHSANGWLVFRIARKLGLEEMPAISAAIFFLAAPAAFLPLH